MQQQGFFHFQIKRYLVVENKKFRIAQVVGSCVLIVILMIVGSLTGLIYDQDYAIGTAYIHPDQNSDMEAKLDNDLYQASLPDFMLTPISDWLFLPRK